MTNKKQQTALIFRSFHSEAIVSNSIFLIVVIVFKNIPMPLFVLVVWQMKCSHAQFDRYSMPHSPRGTKYTEQFVDG